MDEEKRQESDHGLGLYYFMNLLKTRKSRRQVQVLYAEPYMKSLVHNYRTDADLADVSTSEFLLGTETKYRFPE